MEEVVKISALCAACTLFVAPLRDFEEVRRRKHVGDRSVFPFVCMWACCTLWIVYGLFSGDIVPTVVTNLCGFICSMYYCAVFVWAVEPAKRKNQAYNLFAGTFLVVCAICTFCFGSFSPQSNRLPRPDPTPDDRVLRHAGLAASAFTVLQYASPLADLLKVLKRQSTEGISRLLASISLICALLWLMYGILTDNAFIYVPNFLGVASCVAQFALFCMFPRNRGKSEGSMEKEKSLV